VVQDVLVEEETDAGLRGVGGDPGTSGVEGRGDGGGGRVVVDAADEVLGVGVGPGDLGDEVGVVEAYPDRP
jgi:hypothetical protein